MAGRYDWETIRAEFEAGATMGALSRRHGVNKAAISRRARKEGWTADLTDEGHDIGGGDGGVKFQPAFLDFRDELFSAGDVGTGGTGFGFLFALTEYGHTNGLAQTVRQGDGAANHLVGIFGVNAAADGHVHSFVKLGERSAEGLLHGFLYREALGEVEAFYRLTIFFPEGHCSILSKAGLPTSPAESLM